jgi:hypothetical protein
MAFGDAPRFEVLADGTFYARAGVQTNSAGVAGVHVRITPDTSGRLTFRLVAGAPTGGSYGVAVPGRAVPPAFRDALFRGAREAFGAHAPGLGVCFELIDALVHPVDANESKFAAAGVTAMEGWLKLYARGSVGGQGGGPGS